VDKPERERTADAQTTIIISNVLRAGVFLSAGLIGLGILESLTHAPQDIASVKPPHTALAIWQGLWSGDPEATIMAGIVVLLLTPVVRVAISALAFAFERDWRYVAITLLVLGILVTSFLIGKGGA
jgi:uncharacterized membrane protein